MTVTATPTASVIQVEGLDALIGLLRDQGYRTVGPTVRDGAVVYADIDGVADLPRGVGDLQEAGSYRLTDRGDDALFGYAAGPHSFKRELFPPSQRLWTARRDGDVTWDVVPEPHEPPRLALVGVRPCELAAIAVQDRVFLQGPYPDEIYRVRRSNVVTVAVNCSDPSGTCFCASMGTGPRASAGYDLACTELLDTGEHRFVVEAGSKRGATLLAAVDTTAATDDDLTAAGQVTARATARMGRTLDTTGIVELLTRNPEHPHWDEVAQRCLTCGNCTLVCPTCFCTTVEDTTDLTVTEAYRDRRWDSCFTVEFTHAGPSSVRTSTRARYRQWLTHKLATWVEQFGTSGCVGCGRCITWCPVGIDITAEVDVIRTGTPTATSTTAGTPTAAAAAPAPR